MAHVSWNFQRYLLLGVLIDEQNDRLLDYQSKELSGRVLADLIETHRCLFGQFLEILHEQAFGIRVHCFDPIRRCQANLVRVYIFRCCPNHVMHLATLKQFCTGHIAKCFSIGIKLSQTYKSPVLSTSDGCFLLIYEAHFNDICLCAAFPELGKIVIIID